MTCSTKRSKGAMPVVAEQLQRKGLGELLLADALQRCLHLSDEIGTVGVVVDAKDERARGWYERYEFERLPDLPLTLWLPTLPLGNCDLQHSHRLRQFLVAYLLARKQELDSPL